MQVRALVCGSLLACGHAPSPSLPPRAGTPLAAAAVVATTPVRANGFAAFAAEVYAAHAAGDRAAVRALLDRREALREAFVTRRNAEYSRRQAAEARGERFEEPDPEELASSCTEAPRQVTSPGGTWVFGGRSMARIDASGAIQETRILPACVLDFDGELLTLDRGNDPYFLLANRKELSLAPGARASSTKEWALLVGDGDSYKAMRRRDEKVFERAPNAEVESYEWHGPWLTGAWLVDQRKAAIHAEHAERGGVEVRGCRGEIVDAAQTSTGLAILVQPRSTNEDSPSAATRLCRVGADGKTLQVLNLGHAVCGLASARPCPWELALVHDDLIVLGSTRGDVKFVDAARGRTLKHSLDLGESIAQPCGSDVCLDSWGENAELRTRVRANLAAGRIDVVSTAPTPPDLPLAGWCNHEGLLVPAEYCPKP